MSLALSAPIFNKKSNRTRAVETIKLWPNFLLKIGTLRAKGKRKPALILYVGGSAPAPLTLHQKF